MIFEKLELKNFASYYDRHELALGVSDGKPLVIFVGGTGFGKTTLFDAINWALYGEDYEYDLSKVRERDILDFINEETLKEAARGKTDVDMFVRLTFSHDLDRYVISQNITAFVTKLKNGSLEPQLKHRATSLRKIGVTGDYETIEWQKTFLDEILPNNVKSYFLFDGDRIYNLANPGNSQEVRDAIYRVVDLEIIKNAQEHLQQVAIEYARNAKRLATGQLQEVEEKYAKNLELREDLKRSKLQCKKEIASIGDQHEKLEGRLADIPETEKLQERKHRILDDLSRKQNEYKETKIGIRPKLTIAAYKFAIPQVEALTNLIDAKRRRKEIPKHISETLIKDIIETGTCICGTSFDLDSSPHRALLARLEREKGKLEQEQDILKLLYDLQDAQEKIQEAIQFINDEDDKLATLEEEIRAEKMKLEEVEAELDKLPQEDVSVIRQKIKELRAKRDALFKQEQEYAVHLENISNDIVELEKERKKLGKEQKEANLLQSRSEISRKAFEILESLYDDFAEESRQEVEKLTIEEFKKFVISSSNYHVELSKDYELQVLDSNGNRALQRLSMGQSQCLSLAFITAISRVSQKQPPLVIDMPFSRLDRDTHRAVSERLPKLSKQAILFLIPEVEWNDDTREILTHSASHIYQLGFKESERKTIVEKSK